MFLKKNYGMTLIEVLISVTIGLFMLLVLSNIYINGKRTFALQNSLARMQENARLVFDVMSKEIQQAGYAACGTSSTTNPLLRSTREIVKEIDNHHVYVQYYSFINPSNIALELSHGSLNTISPSIKMTSLFGPISISGDPYNWQGAVPDMIIADCESIEGLYPTSISSSDISLRGPLGKLYGSDARIMREESVRFFLATPLGANYKSIYYHFNNGAADKYLRLADYVERVDYAYGYGDKSTSATILGYTDRAGIEALPDSWRTVKSIRISILFRSITEILDSPTDYIYNFAKHTPTDKYLRKEMSTVIALRNRITDVN